MSHQEKNQTTTFKDKVWRIIFLADTPAGKTFDVALLIAILISIVLVFLESVKTLHDRYFNLFYTLEWILTIFFTIEYFTRLYVARRPLQYALSFFGIIDLLSIIPTYLSLFITGTQSLIVIRAFRLLRAFRIFKLVGYLRQGRFIVSALKASRTKIEIFIFFVLVMVTILGCFMYLIEGGQNSSEFDSIPRSVYWAIVTLTTVGYGDISPVTPLGQALAAVVMIMGYAIIAVPTGIVSAEMAKSGNPITSRDKRFTNPKDCPSCNPQDHAHDAGYCKFCGDRINLRKE